MSLGDGRAPAPPPPPGRAPFWRVVQLVAGVALFLWALRTLAPMPLARGPFVALAALLAAGAMAVADGVVSVVAGVIQSLTKGRDQ